MNRSEHKHQLEQSFALTPQLSNFDTKNQWLYVTFPQVIETINAVFLSEVKDLAEITRILRLRPRKTIKVRTHQK